MAMASNETTTTKTPQGCDLCIAQCAAIALSNVNDTGLFQTLNGEMYVGQWGQGRDIDLIKLGFDLEVSSVTLCVFIFSPFLWVLMLLDGFCIVRWETIHAGAHKGARIWS